MALGAWSIPVTHPAPADLAAWLSGVSLAGLGRPVGAHADWEREAKGCARSWLRLVDEGRHTASWTAASSLLKEEVGPSGWDAALRAVIGEPVSGEEPSVTLAREALDDFLSPPETTSPSNRGRINTPPASATALPIEPAGLPQAENRLGYSYRKPPI